MKHSKFSAWFETAMFILCAVGFFVGYLHRDAINMLWCGFIGAIWFRCAETAWKESRR
jgi:hypothetical protein